MAQRHRTPVTVSATRLPVASLLLVLPLLAVSQPASDDKHMGVATCASSVCHGKLAAQTDRDVGLNEYRLWTRARRHSQAYRLLENAESRAIADKLGLASATTAKVCLDCHADNVTPDQRGPRFQLTDGVACEACHGGAERWIESHAEAGATHANNLARGMYPTESLLHRAALCLGCHMGTAEKFASHDLLGAGHPRLSFELETFSTEQPAHHTVDDDYRERKGDAPAFNLWLAGQLQSGTNFLALIASNRYTGNNAFPELAFYDCHACHHALDRQRWSQTRAGPGIPPGTPRLMDHPFLILEAVAGVLEDSASAAELRRLTEAYVASGRSDRVAVGRAAAALAGWLRSRDNDWVSARYDIADLQAVRRALIAAASTDRMSDYVAAEQVYLALESLSYSIGDRSSRTAALDALFAEVATADAFDPDAFRAVSRRFRDRF